MSRKNPEIQAGNGSISAGAAPPAFGTLPNCGSDGLILYQSELLYEIDSVRRYWADRTRTEAQIAADFVNRLTAARSVPEATAACQGWVRQRFELAVQDTQYMVGTGTEFINASLRFSGPGAPVNGETSRL